MVILPRLLILLLAVALGSAALTLASADEGRAEAREQFLAAESALQRGDLATFERLQQALRDYPLLPYLENAALRRNLGQRSDREIAAFLASHADSPLAYRLRRSWLHRLADAQQWRRFMAFYQDDMGTTLRCHQLHALLQTGQRGAALTAAPDLWLHGESRPDACDPLFDAWRAAGGLTPELVWQRFALAMAARQSGLARYLTRYLPASERPLAERWLAIHRRPLQLLEEPTPLPAHAHRWDILAHAVARQAGRDENQAITLWQALQERYALPPAEHQRITADLAEAVQRAMTARVEAWLRHQDPAAASGEVRVRWTEALAEAALLRADWGWLHRLLSSAPAELLAAERWRYWQARAAGANGDDAAARRGYQALARERSYYGFMAADRASQPYRFAHQDTPVTPALRARMEALPALQRAAELLALERMTDARREWEHAMRRLNTEEQMAAAEIAESWGWHDRAIFTLAKTDYWDDLVLRFPLRHRELVEAAARDNGLEPAWIFAILRQESAFMADARSRAGARGLMQLMPATARQVAKWLPDTPKPRNRDLHDPALNIRLGSRYLRALSERFGDHPALISAGYNAGPRRVSHWLPEDEVVPTDLWVERIPFRETRGYVRRVLYYTAIYEERLGTEVTRLAARLGRIGPEGPLEVAEQEAPGIPSTSG